MMSFADWSALAFPGTTESMQSINQPLIGQRNVTFKNACTEKWTHLPLRCLEKARVRLSDQLHAWFKHNHTHDTALQSNQYDMLLSSTLFKSDIQPSPERYVRTPSASTIKDNR